MVTFLAGIQIQEVRFVRATLTSFFGIGPNVADRLMAKLSIHRAAKMGSLPSKTVTQLTYELGRLNIENNLRKQLLENIDRLRKIGSTRGRRHALGLPVRGQHTQTQAMTARKLNKTERRFKIFATT